MVPQPRVRLKEYLLLDGSKVLLVNQVGDGSIIKRFDKTVDEILGSGSRYSLKNIMLHYESIQDPRFTDKERERNMLKGDLISLSSSVKNNKYKMEIKKENKEGSVYTIKRRSKASK